VLCGEQDRHLRILEKLEGVTISVRGNVISLHGDEGEVRHVKNLLTQLVRLVERGYPLYPQDIEYAHRALASNSHLNLETIFLDQVFVSSGKR